MAVRAGLRLASRRVTVSTAGLVPRLSDLGRDTRVNLAVSLNATDNNTRSRLMPINRTYPLEKLLEACRQYQPAPGRRITFEYILIKGINDSESDARRLAKQMGLDPDKWFANTESAMLMLSQKEFSKKARYGFVNGKEPVNYVREIKQRFEAYVSLSGTVTAGNDDAPRELILAAQ